MRKWIIGTFIWCSMVLLGSVRAQEEVVSEVVALPEPACTSHGTNAVPTVEELRAEAEAKDTLIKSLNLCTHAQNALMIAAESMSLEALQQYLAQEHHAYDGHTVLEHAAMKVKFALPMTRKPCPECGKTVYHADPDGQLAAWTHHYTNGKLQYSRFPIPLQIYAKGEEGMGLWDKLVHRVKVDNFNLAATIIFLLAILHTFMAPMFQKWAHHMEKAHKQKLRDAKFRILHPEQRMPVSFGSTLCHFLGEVEVVFGLWIIPFAFVCQHYYSMDDFLRYIDHDTSFTEPLFVAVIMVIASSRPIYRLAENTL
ncbi:MAG: putative Na+/H+ antiporter, partial [Akkermansia sp.]|nr:putative Na+/H+ antiporter [Akkermansia sp.]